MTEENIDNDYNRCDAKMLIPQRISEEEIKKKLLESLPHLIPQAVK